MFTRTRLPLNVCGLIVVLLKRTGVPGPRSAHRYVSPVGTILTRTTLPEFAGVIDST